MATRYWVGGSGTWNASNTANWSATSGGSGGASAPTTTDDVVFNSSSGSGTVFADYGAVCANLTMSSGLSLTQIYGYISVYGSLSRSNNSCDIESISIVMQSTNTVSMGTDGARLMELTVTGLSVVTITALTNIYTYNTVVGSGSTFNLNGYTLNTRAANSSGNILGGTISFAAWNATYYQLYILGDWSTSTITVSTSYYQPTININNSVNPAYTGNITFSYVGTYDVQNLYAKNITINNGANLTLAAGLSVYCYGTFYLYPSATLTATSTATIYFNKVSGSPTVSRLIRIDGTLTPTKKVSFTVDAGADTITFGSGGLYALGSPSNIANTIFIKTPTTFTCYGVYAQTFLVASSATCDISGLAGFGSTGLNVGAINNQTTSLTVGSTVVSFYNYGSGYCTFTPGTATYSTVTLVDAVALLFTGNGTIGTLNCVSSLGQGNTKALQFDGGATYTITSALNLTGASASDQVSLTVKSGTTPAIVSKSSGTVTATYATISYSTATGGATFYALATQGNVNGGGNSGWIFQAASGNFLAFF